MAAQEPRSGHEARPATAVLNAKAQALQDLLKEVFSPFNPTQGMVVDMPEVLVEPRDIQDVCRIAKEDPRLDFKMLLCLATVDYKEYFQVVYFLLSIDREQKLCIKTNLPYEDPQLSSVTSLWRGADWYEREAHDLFGIVFNGHNNLHPLLLYEGFEGFPGRKDYPFHDYQEF